MKYIVIIIIFICQNFYLKGQISIDSLPSVYLKAEVSKIRKNSEILSVKRPYDNTVKGIQYYKKERKKGNIDSLLCRYTNLLYLNVNDVNFDTNLLKCIKDSLSYFKVSSYSTKYKLIDFELNSLKEIVGWYNMPFLASLLKNSPKFTASELEAEGRIELIEDIAFNNLRYFWIDSEENCFCRKDLSFPKSLFNAPNLEILYLSHYCKKYFFSRDKYFSMPEITSDSSKITNLTIYRADLSDENTLKQIKKLKKLEYLEIGFTGIDYSNLEQLRHIKKITLFVPNKYWKKGIMTDEIAKEINRKYPNVGIS